MDKRQDIHIGIAGFGKAAEVYHSPFILNTSGLKVTKILERHKERSQKLFPSAKIVRSFSDLVNDPELDVVVVTTPNDLHYSMVKEALEGNKHVVVDKPFTLTVQEADELIALAEQKGKILTVYHNRRLDGPFLAVKKAIEERVVGDPFSLEIKFDRYRPEVKDTWRESERKGAGLLYDIGAHLIDYVIALFGAPVSYKSEVLTERENSKVDDYFDISFDYKKVKARVSAGMLVPEKTPHFSLTGPHGQFIIWDLDPQESALKQGLVPDCKDWPKTIEADFIPFDNSQQPKKVTFKAGDYTEFYRNLLNAIHGKEELLVKPVEAREVIRIIEKSKQYQ